MKIQRENGEVENRPKSKGGQLFDWLTYGGFAGVGTFFLTIPIANALGKGGRFEGFHNWIMRTSQKFGATEKLGETISETCRFFQGGNVMLIPVGIMEHFRTPIVTGFNRALNDPTDPQSIKDAPPQTAGSILKARLMAWGTVFVGLFSVSKIAPEGFAKLKNAFGEGMCKIMKRPIRLPDGEFSKTYKFGEAGAIDLFATIAAATLLYIGSHFFARKAQEKKIGHEKPQQEQQQEPAAPAPVQNETPTPTPTVSDIKREEKTVAAAPVADINAPALTV